MQPEYSGTSKGNCRMGECGIALLLVLLTLLLLSAMGLGLIYMSNTETAVNANYRDTQLAFFAMRAGLEEARDRIRSNSPSPITVPIAMPGAANSILYITNPANGETVAPLTPSSPYFDDEFCHESYSGLSLSDPGTGIPCTASAPSGNVTTVASVSPNTGTASALKYKWVRITLKQNSTLSTAIVNSAAAGNSQVCYSTASGEEIPVSLLSGGAYPTCAAAQAAGKDTTPVYIITSLAVTPQGSRRMGQYEVAALNLMPPAGALGLDGPNSVFSPRPSSNQFYINGNDSAPSSGWGTSQHPATTCTPTGPPQVPAISTGDATGAAGITTAITGNPNRSSNYTGSGGTPSVVNVGTTGTGTYSGPWASPSALDNLVNTLAGVADVTYTCGIGSPCNPSGSVGTDANPQITYVDGDFNYGNASGAGVLVVTGTLSFNGNASFDGLILVIGQGIVSESGGGNGGFNGSIFVANTRNSTAPYAELATLGSPTYSWNGGGNSDIQYNSCWANVGNSIRYGIISMNEKMY